MAGNHGIYRVAPFPPRLVDVGVTDTAEIDFQQNVMCAGITALEVERLQF
jgi:hypothetical protein